MYGTLYLSVNAGICADSGGIKIYVLDNDEDEDGDQLEITDVGTPTSNDDGSVNGTAIAEDDDGDGVDDFISYTPSYSPDTVTFEYTISDGNGGTDTAEVTVNVTGDNSSCGPLTVRVVDQSENLVNATFTPMYDTTNTSDGVLETLPPKSGEWTYNVEVTDKPRLSEMNGGLLDIPDGFATSVDRFNKDVEETASGQKEPDDFWYPLQNRNNKKSKLATDPDGDDDGGDDGGTTTTSYNGYGYTYTRFCHTLDAYTYIEHWEADVTEVYDPDGNLVNTMYDNIQYIAPESPPTSNPYIFAGNSENCTEEIEEDTASGYDAWVDGDKPAMDEPDAFCESAQETPCWPEENYFDWPTDDGDDDGNQTCDSYENIDPYPKCPPGATKETYGHPTCENRCER